MSNQQGPCPEVVRKPPCQRLSFLQTAEHTPGAPAVGFGGAQEPLQSPCPAPRSRFEAPAQPPACTYLSFFAIFSLTETWMTMGKMSILCRVQTLSSWTSRRAWVFFVGGRGEVSQDHRPQRKQREPTPRSEGPSGQAEGRAGAGQS